MKENDLKEKVEKCKTEKQVRNLLKKSGIKIVKDNSEECGTFSIWLDELTRIYKDCKRGIRFQKWQKVEMKYSGVPVFFGNTFDKYF